jgi:hypothetical protein
MLSAPNFDALIVHTNVARLQAGEEFNALDLAFLNVDSVPPRFTLLSTMDETDRFIARERVDTQLVVAWDGPEHLQRQVLTSLVNGRQARPAPNNALSRAGLLFVNRSLFLLKGPETLIMTCLTN